MVVRGHNHGLLHWSAAGGDLVERVGVLEVQVLEMLDRLEPITDATTADAAVLVSIADFQPALTASKVRNTLVLQPHRRVQPLPVGVIEVVHALAVLGQGAVLIARRVFGEDLVVETGELVDAAGDARIFQRIPAVSRVLALHMLTATGLSDHRRELLVTASHQSRIRIVGLLRQRFLAGGTEFLRAQLLGWLLIRGSHLTRGVVGVVRAGARGGAVVASHQDGGQEGQAEKREKSTHVSPPGGVLGKGSLKSKRTSANPSTRCTRVVLAQIVFLPNGQEKNGSKPRSSEYTTPQ